MTGCAGSSCRYSRMEGLSKTKRLKKGKRKKKKNKISKQPRLLTHPLGWLNFFNAELSLAEEVPAGTEIPGGGERGRLYLTLCCHRQTDCCIKVGNDESHMNFSLITRAVTSQCPQTYTFEERGELELNQTKVVLLNSLTLYH